MLKLLFTIEIAFLHRHAVERSIALGRRINCPTGEKSNYLCCINLGQAMAEQKNLFSHCPPVFSRFGIDL
jgi:hypothetical protein